MKINENVRKWLPLAAITAVVLLGFYAWVWLSRVGCGPTPIGACLITALATRGADLLWMGWIKDYQTLIAGLIAFGGGAFVILSARRQRADFVADQDAARVERSLATIAHIQELLSRVFDEATRAANADIPTYIRSRSADSVDKLLVQLDGMVPQALNIGQEFGVWLGGALSEIREYQLSEKNTDTGKLLVTVLLSGVVVRDPFTLIDDRGYYRRHIATLDSTTRDLLVQQGISISDIWSVKRYVK